MTMFKARCVIRGGHVQCQFFAAPRANSTFAGLGQIMVRIEEFPALRLAMPTVNFESLEMSGAELLKSTAPPVTGSLEAVEACLRTIEMSMDRGMQLEAIMSVAQACFDLGCKAAGGAIMPDARPGQARYVEIALDQPEIDGLVAVIRVAGDEPEHREALERVLEKIGMFRSSR